MSKWISPVPEQCDICQRKLKKEFIDGKTVMGPWGIMCGFCHTRRGCGLGIGKGQRFDLETLECVEGGSRC